MSATLTALLDARVMGRVRQGDRGRLTFAYDSSWRGMPQALPLSLSMPLSVGEHGHDVMDSFLRGLLPDNDAVLTAWGRRFGVSPRNPFALLAHVGEDCAGAVQFVHADRLDVVLGQGAEEVHWIDEDEVRIAARSEECARQLER